MRPVRRLCLGVMLAAAAACADRVEFADWTIPVPDGTRIVEHTYVPLEERTEVIDLAEELVIGGDGSDPRYSSYNPRALAVDDEGRIYLADAADHQVKVYDRNGTHVRSLGRQGQGPAEFSGPGGVVVAGSMLAVLDGHRISYWDLEGEYVGEVSVTPQSTTASAGLDDGTLVARYPSFDDASARQVSVFVRWDAEGSEQTRFAELLDPPPVSYPSRRAEGRVLLSIAPAIPRFAAQRTGRVYVIKGDEYQILAYESSGALAWALRTAYARPPVSRIEIDRGMENIRRRFPGATESEVDWPRAEPALNNIWVDGHGHLYVFPYVTGSMSLEPAQRPVDVYADTGERLFSGLLATEIWIWASRFHLHGDHVYDIRRRADGDDEIVAYRLVEPF